ncbi:MAG: methylmalonyl-CoA epimerase [Candidatus Marinimicrobia bacterium]|nr:methylmalonyl-CoA epimerase [Candidatus Neomarinimicrobiota bacterium]
MKIIGIEHIAIATKDLEHDSSFWSDILGINNLGKEIVKNEGVVTDIYNTDQGKVELLAEYGKESHITKFLEKRGSGLHHVCFEVEDIHEAVKELKSKGIQLISDKPTMGAEGYQIVFIHPKSAGGVLVELCQKQKAMPQKVMPQSRGHN